MIGPVSINNPNFSNGRLTMLYITKIILTEFQVLKAHGKATIIHEGLKFTIRKRCKTSKDLNIRRRLQLHLQGLRLFQLGLTAFHCVNIIILYFGKSGIIDASHQNHNPCSCNNRAFLLGNKLYALSGRVSSLVILSRQIFGSKHPGIGKLRKLLLVYYINRWFRKYHRFYCSIFLITKALDIVAVKQPYSSKISQAKTLNKVIAKLLSRDIIEPLTLLHVNSSYSHQSCLQKLNKKTASLYVIHGNLYDHLGNWCEFSI